MQYVVIDNWETCPSPWLLAEYRYVAELFGESLVIANVRGRAMSQALEDVAETTALDLTEFIRSESMREENVVILDPLAEKELRPEEVRRADAVVIGGIMGDYPPKGRTWELISGRHPHAILRNLGREQLTIAGSAYMLKKISEGLSLGDIDVRFGLTVELKILNSEVTVYLPYAFPYEGGVPVLPKKYIETVAMRSVYFEGAEVNDLCL
ncbi:MAG: hypothetical protein QW705_07575 [Zestosphaera sp.]